MIEFLIHSIGWYLIFYAVFYKRKVNIFKKQYWFLLSITILGYLILTII